MLSDEGEVHGDSAHEVDTAPVWMAVGDLMAGMLGLFVMFLLWTLVLQADLAADLEAEKQARTEVTQRLDTLEQVLAAPLAAGRISLVDGRIGIRGNVLFDLNSAGLRDEGRALLEELAAPLERYLGGRDEIVMVSGFTDDLPIHGKLAPFADNWELSTARALTVTRALIAAGLRPERLFAAGFGEHHPTVPNVDATSRAQNRRVEIVPVPRSRDGAPKSAR